MYRQTETEREGLGIEGQTEKETERVVQTETERGGMDRKRDRHGQEREDCTDKQRQREG